MSKKNNSDSGIGCAMVLMLAVFAMPLVGLYLAVTGKENEQRILGLALLIVGIIVWIKIGITT
mgnify:CR=1 FL=1